VRAIYENDPQAPFETQASRFELSQSSCGSSGSSDIGLGGLTVERSLAVAAESLGTRKVFTVDRNDFE
jgi:hypothetical protein